MKTKTLSQIRKNLNNQLNKIEVKNLNDWLKEASKIPELTTALEGIYCGKEGRIHSKLEDYNIYITMGWYTVDQTIVEYCYVS